MDHFRRLLHLNLRGLLALASANIHFLSQMISPTEASTPAEDVAALRFKIAQLEGELRKERERQ